jgi:hypothetical protein
MIGRTLLGMLPGTAPHQRLQVALMQRGDGRLTIDLREQHHADGIGWYDQRALELDPQQFRQLQAMLGLKAGRAVADQASGPEAENDRPATIPFPGPCDQGPSRSAVGE